MTDMTWWRPRLLIAAILAVGLWPAGSLADTAQLSPSYSINESQIGGIGDFNSQSPSYSFKPGVDDGGSTLGDTFIGNSASTSYQTNSGFNTTAQPNLTFAITSGNPSLGVLSTSSKSTATATMKAIDYTSYGYVITIVGTPPANGAHALTALAADTASSAGTEQFGLNLVRNTTAAVGADPVQAPVGPPTFGYGVAGDGATGTYGTTRPYTISDKWRYVSGETLASSPKSTGETDYTMTFMANESITTPGGAYSSNLTLICTGTF